jgi:hypothetical protein
VRLADHERCGKRIDTHRDSFIDAERDRQHGRLLCLYATQFDALQTLAR